MAHYLAPIFREQFNQFYSFGHTFIPKINLLEFDGTIDTTTKNRLVEHFSILPPFEYDMSYLILHLESNKENEVIRFQLQDIVALYPLSKQAKLSIEERFFERIRLNEPVFESILPSIQAAIRNTQALKAIEALWKICDLDGDYNTAVSEIGTGNLNKGLKYRSKGLKLPQILNTYKDVNYWSYLIAYDRYDYFPKNTLGYFYDAGEIFSYYRGKPDGVVGTKIHEFLERLNNSASKLNIDDIVYEIENSPLTTKYINDPISISSRHYITTVLYLRWKDELKNCNGNISEVTLIKPDSRQKLLKRYPNEVKTALVLIGAFYGFQQPLYDAYYESLNLRIHKGYKQGDTFSSQPKNKATTKIKVVNPKDVNVTNLTLPFDSPNPTDTDDTSKCKDKVSEQNTLQITSLEPLVADKSNTPPYNLQSDLSTSINDDGENTSRVINWDINSGTPNSSQGEDKGNDYHVNNSPPLFQNEAPIDKVELYQQLINSMLNKSKEVKLADVITEVKKAKIGTINQTELIKLIEESFKFLEVVPGRTKLVRYK